MTVKIMKYNVYKISFKLLLPSNTHPVGTMGRRGRDFMVAGLTTTYAISAYHHRCCEFESRSGRGVQQYTI